MSITAGNEVGTALGRLEADRPRLAERLVDVSAFARVAVFFLRAVDMYFEENALSSTERKLAEFDARIAGDSLVVALTHPSRPGAVGNWQGGSVPRLATGWIWARTVRLARLLEHRNVMESTEALVRKLEEYCLQYNLEPRKLHIREGYPKLIRGLSYLVYEFDR